MQVILLERVENLGQMGDEVRVKPGFARNYLLPQKKALRASKDNRAYFEAQRKELEARNLERKREAEQAAKKLENLTVTMIRQAGETGQLYGSVTSRDIAEALKDMQANVERSQVQLNRQIKTVGLHPVTIRLHPEVAVEITVNVARSEGEAQTQIEAGETVTPEEQQEVAEQTVEEVLSEVEAIEAEEAEAAEAEAAESGESEEDEASKA